MLRNSSLEVGVRCRRSGRVSGDPSMNFEGRRARFGLFVGGLDIFEVLGSFSRVRLKPRIFFGCSRRFLLQITDALID